MALINYRIYALGVIILLAASFARAGVETLNRTTAGTLRNLNGSSPVPAEVSEAPPKEIPAEIELNFEELGEIFRVARPMFYSEIKAVTYRSPGFCKTYGRIRGGGDKLVPFIAPAAFLSHNRKSGSRVIILTKRSDSGTEFESEKFNDQQYRTIFKMGWLHTTDTYYEIAKRDILKPLLLKASDESDLDTFTIDRAFAYFSEDSGSERWTEKLFAHPGMVDGRLVYYIVDGRGYVMNEFRMDEDGNIISSYRAFRPDLASDEFGDEGDDIFDRGLRWRQSPVTNLPQFYEEIEPTMYCYFQTSH